MQYLLIPVCGVKKFLWFKFKDASHGEPLQKHPVSFEIFVRLSRPFISVKKGGLAVNPSNQSTATKGN